MDIDDDSSHLTNIASEALTLLTAAIAATSTSVGIARALRIRRAEQAQHL